MYRCILLSWNVHKCHDLFTLQNVEPVFARVPMGLLLQAAFDEEIIADANSPIDNRPTGLGRRLRMQTMPAYLWVTIRVREMGHSKLFSTFAHFLAFRYR